MDRADTSQDISIIEPTGGSKPDAQQASPSAALIVDGIFLHRPELGSYWDLSIFLKVDFDVSVPRGAARDQTPDAIDPETPAYQRYVGGQRRYLAECAPERQADIVIDYNDLQAPEVVKWTVRWRIADGRAYKSAKTTPCTVGSSRFRGAC